jgi:hypothetical protein
VHVTAVTADQIKWDEMGGPCGTYGNVVKCTQGCGLETEGQKPFGRE